MQKKKHKLPIFITCAQKETQITDIYFNLLAFQVCLICT